MPEIRFEPQKRCVAVLMDGEPAFETTASILRQTGVHSGDVLSEEEYDSFYQTCMEQRAQKKALSLLSRQGMSKKALTKKLGGDAAAAVVADQMEETGCINDERYAYGRAELLICRRLHSPVKAEFELLRQGIPRELARRAVEEVGRTPRENISRLLESHYRSKMKEPDGLKKVVCALLRAGYRMDDIRAVMGNVPENECEDVFNSWESE